MTQTYAERMGIKVYIDPAPDFPISKVNELVCYSFDFGDEKKYRQHWDFWIDPDTSIVAIWRVKSWK